LAILHEGQGNNKSARELLARLTKANPAHADGWYQAGRLAERSNDLLEAAYAYRQAIAAKPNLVDAHYNLGFILRSQNKPAEAEKEFLEVIRYRPEYAEAHMNLGVVYTSMNKLEEAEREYERAVALKPDYAEAHYNLGVFYELHRKDMPRALAQYHKYRNLGGRDDRVERIIGTAGR
jgi:tetratricopeptide (TPR) repeat protein